MELEDRLPLALHFAPNIRHVLTHASIILPTHTPADTYVIKSHFYTHTGRAASLDHVRNTEWMMSGSPTQWLEQNTLKLNNKR